MWETKDPLNKASDKEIIQVLDRVALWPVTKGHGGLDTVCSEGMFSHGQRQLLYKARTMFKEGNLDMLDECTSPCVSVVFLRLDVTD
jgi:ABC-type transport system involved in cytochrome bd biosynthesis fused ATPase/permease subunit